MFFDDVACITATREEMKLGRYPYEEEYRESREKVLKLISDCRRAMPWKKKPATWFSITIAKAYKTFARLFGG
jgi:hypothetical protein